MAEFIPLVDLKRQYACYRAEVDAAVARVFADAAFVGGSELKAFNEELAAFASVGAPVAYTALGCSSGTDALLLALLVLGIGPGDEVITTPYSFIATAEVIALVGAVPVFVDVHADTYAIAAAQVAAAITLRTRVILPVGLFGVPAAMDDLAALAKQYPRITVIEDAAQSFGAEYHGRRSGALAPLSCTSFYPPKPLGCAGDGGAVLAATTAHATRIAQLLNHGQTQRYEHAYIGINGRLDALQAAVLRVKLRHFAAELQVRRKLATRYNAELKREHFTPQCVPAGIQSTFAQYSLTCSSAAARTALTEHLTANGIAYGIYYPKPLHLQPAFSRYGYQRGAFPVAEHLAETMLSIPVHPFLSAKEQERIIAVMNHFQT